MERTCVIVKPDGVGKKVVGAVLQRFENEGLKLVAMKMVKPNRSVMEQFYAVHAGKSFFEPFIQFVTSGPIVVTVWEASVAIQKVRGIIGATNAKEAAPGTLRNLHGTDNRRNLVHASDSAENAAREIEFFFTPLELMQYDLTDWEKA
ncbi:MAG: nucleoside-diphosphate kinase [Elusimicrobia bacterium]|nr:nucleoside-diphosphate kinase [Elusimicrobiota bacterium]